MSLDERRPLLGASETRPDEQDHVSCPDDAVPDPDDPILWPAPFKWGIVALLAAMGFVVTFTCTSVIPLAAHIVRELDGNSSGNMKSASVLLVTIWELGEAAGPLFLAPLSEVYGRYPVINVANLLFIAATALAATCHSASIFIGARALTGLAVASNVLNPAIIGDILEPERRGVAMTLVMMAPLLGGAVGPAISSLVAESLGWRLVLWICVVLAGTCELVFLACFRETYRIVIMRRKAATALKSLDSDIEPLAQAPPRDDGEIGGFWESVLRPFVIFASSGILRIMCLFSGISFAFFYIVSVTLPEIVEVVYGKSLATAGSSLLCFSAGSTVGVIICSRSLDGLYTKLSRTNRGVGKPEFRLPLAVAGGLLLPGFVLLFGCVAQLHLPLPLMLTSVLLLGISVMLCTLPTVAYVIDAFGCYSASALTGLIFVRSLFGTFLPLVVGPLDERFGYGGGFAILAGLCLCLCLVPAVVMRTGPKWRQRSKYSRD